MAEYIEREAVVKYLRSRKGDFLDDYGKGWSAGIGAASGICGEFPAADVAPVVRGRWEWKHRHHGGFRKYTGVDEFGETHTITVDERIECDEPYCPYCGRWNESVFLNYCPNCGAKMEG